MATTPKWAIPYPVGTDRVMDGDNVMQSIAERIELVSLYAGAGSPARVQSGSVVLTPVSAIFTITYPVPFASKPFFAMAIPGDIGAARFCAVNFDACTAADLIGAVWAAGGTAATGAMRIQYIAIGAM